MKITGIEGLWQAPAVAPSSGTERRALPPELDPIVPISGRDQELRWLAWHWRRARHGHGRITKGKITMIYHFEGLKRIEVQGHTDNTGSAEYNLKLSDARASAVMNYLISKGVPASSLVAKGYGPDFPIDTNATAAGRASVRRT